jgi:hypothetical protein
MHMAQAEPALPMSRWTSSARLSTSTTDRAGNVGDRDDAAISARFGRIAARRVASPGSIPPASPNTTRVVLPGLERPAVMLVFPAPGEGSDSDAAIDLLDGMSMPLAKQWSLRYAYTMVIGERRALDRRVCRGG